MSRLHRVWLYEDVRHVLVKRRGVSDIAIERGSFEYSACGLHGALFRLLLQMCTCPCVGRSVLVEWNQAFTTS